MPGVSLAAGVALCAAGWLFLRAGAGARFRGTPPGAVLLDTLPVAAGFALALAATARPLLSGAALAVTALGLRLTDTVKREVLHEPVDFADRAELPEVVRHPSSTFPSPAPAWSWPPPPWPPPSPPPWSGPSRRCGSAPGPARSCPPPSPSPSPAWGSCSPPGPRPCAALARLYARLHPARDPGPDAARLGPLASLVVHATLAAAERPARRPPCAPARPCPCRRPAP